MYFETLQSGRSKSPKVIDFVTNRKGVSNFLLIISSDIGPFLPHFRDIVGFLLKTAPHLYSTRIFGVFPLD